MKPPKSSLYQGFSYAISGIVSTIKSELHFKIHVLAALLAVSAGIFLQIETHEWLWITLSIAIVMVAELLNTSIESLSNIVSPDYHPLIKKTKDAAAGAVLIAALFALICGLIIFIPHLTEVF
ncbi:diacylglycerol kinase family protein [Albibacterium sp.]|uniref:diacylglycerol kinase family protein n=1 Tax=Albibacterium sp. TaxID=2952885 RepID=UPI002C9079C1|nr:diacylglycerol kinase family protein [Albibacterium sp.]HUH17778.1 diacylglycerol kinase family protein [Albibacterium sp.]